MADPNVERWRQRGTTAMWLDPGSRDGLWNVCADESGCDSMIELLDLMQNALWPSKVKVALTSLTATANGDGAQFKFADSLTLAYPKEGVSDTHWRLTNEGQLLLEVGLQRIGELRTAFTDIRGGGGDYLVGNEPSELWVWWWIGQSDK